MTAKEWLERGRGLEAEICMLREERDRLYAGLTNTAMRLTADKVQTSPRDAVSEKMARYADYGRLLDERIAELMRVKAEILSVLNKIDDNLERRILLLRYIQCKSWGHIGAAVGYERRQVFRVHAGALKKSMTF